MESPLKSYERKKRRGGTILNVIIVVLVVIIILQIVLSLTYTRVYVIGSSMYPTLIGASKKGVSGGDYVLIYDGEPDYGDIVVVERNETTGEDKTLIKRVIALGGDTVYLDHGVLYIKYKGTDEFIQVEESYIDPNCNSSTEPNNTYPKFNGDTDTNGHTVAEGYMFLLGDNRNVSIDSRSSYGDFALDELVGIVSDWSVSCKNVLTGWFTFWDYTLPAVFS